jgi:D-alanyl-lipoteichoic acid acyltransferase DltB (MBOAT superfamily)
MLYTGFENLMAVYGYAIQIYCDFSGYSDMAIGISLLLGFRLPDNFNSPYKSGSITEFWRRWHISLSTWLRDYLYITMGGSRKGRIRTYVNLVLTMLIGGLWHGANWKFVMWGGLHGVALAFEKLLWTWWKPGKHWWGRLAGTVITFHFVCFCWIYFRADNFSSAGQVISQIAAGFDPNHAWQVLVSYKEVFWLMALGYLLHIMPTRVELGYGAIFHRLPLAVKAFYLALFIWIVIQVANADVQPFIYFQF